MTTKQKIEVIARLFKVKPEEITDREVMQLKEMINVKPNEKLTNYDVQRIRKDQELSQYQKRLNFAASCGFYNPEPFADNPRTPVAMHVESFHTHLHYIEAYKKWKSKTQENEN